MTYNQLQTFVALLRRDAQEFRKHIFSRFIDACVWTIIVLYVSQYIMPKFGTKPSFGIFILVSNIAAWGMFEVATNVSHLLADLKGNQSITYYLSLPIPQSWIFLRIALIDAYKSFVSTLPVLPLGKLVLGDSLVFSHISFGKFVIGYFLAHLFFGFFGLFVASLTPSMQYVTTVKLRIVFPMWFFGGYQFSWYMLYQTNEWLAYLSLANPTFYIIEGMRGTVIQDPTLLPFNLCMFMTLGWTIACGILGIHFFKKRLDCL